MAIARTTTTPKTAGNPTRSAQPSPAKAAVPVAVKTPTAVEPRPDQIAQRAFQIWEQTGRQPGRDLENWSQAEAELRRR